MICAALFLQAVNNTPYEAADSNRLASGDPSVSFHGGTMPDRAKAIPANLFRPDRETCLNAISCALLKIRADYGLTAKELAKVASCGPDAIYAATNEEHLLSLDSVVLLCDAFPDECAAIRSLFSGGAAPIPTTIDRLERIERELDAIRREAA